MSTKAKDVAVICQKAKASSPILVVPHCDEPESQEDELSIDAIVKFAQKSGKIRKKILQNRIYFPSFELIYLKQKYIVVWKHMYKFLIFLVVFFQF